MANTLRPIGTLASFFLDPGNDVDASDYRQVPTTDRGNAGYSDTGQRGSFAPHNRDNYPDPTGLKRFSGYGADESDLARGFVRANPNEDPAYDLINYKDRSSQPRVSDEDFGNTAQVSADYEFRGRNRTSRGFIRRPHIPTERG